MRILALIGTPLATVAALAAPGLASAQVLTPQPAPPGGVSSAWPLGLIVLLVAAVAVLGLVWARRRGRAGGPPPRRA